MQKDTDIFIMAKCVVSNLLFERKVSTLDCIPYLLIDWQKSIFVVSKATWAKRDTYFLLIHSAFSPASCLGHYKSNGYFGKFIHPWWILKWLLTWDMIFEICFFTAYRKTRFCIQRWHHYMALRLWQGFGTIAPLWNCWGRSRVPLAVPLQQCRHTLTSLHKGCKLVSWALLICLVQSSVGQGAALVSTSSLVWAITPVIRILARLLSLVSWRFFTKMGLASRWKCTKVDLSY